jgi:hypothetical protein
MDQIGYTNRDELIREIQLRLADNIVEVELDREHLDIAVSLACKRYRQRSSNSREESWLFITTQADKTDYVLPNEVIEVKRVYRRGIGTNSGGGSNFDPFDVAFNNMYMLQAGQIGGLAVFDAFAQYKETIGRIFGSEYNFMWNRNTHTLRIMRNVRHEEDVAIGIFNFVPESVLLQDIYASPWLADYALAIAKQILGEARSKYTTGLPGAGSTIQLNGADLKAEAATTLEKLDQSLKDFEDGGQPYGFIIG